MSKKKKPYIPEEYPIPEQNPEFNPEVIPETPSMPDEDSDIIPEENPFQTPPVEIPPPGEAP